MLRMLVLVLEKFPALFGGGSRAFCFHIMQRLLVLLTSYSGVKCVHFHTSEPNRLLHASRLLIPG